MHSIHHHRRDLRALGDRLVVEYAGALPPGQVLAVVVQVHRAVARHRHPLPATCLAMSEDAARRVITDRLAQTRVVSGGPGLSGPQPPPRPRAAPTTGASAPGSRRRA